MNHFLTVLLLSVFFLATKGENGANPISPADYVKVIGEGFATNYLKTDPPASKYKSQNIDDVYAKGFRNLRLRSRADLYDAPYNNNKFENFLTKLETIVDKCLATNVVPIISWIHHKAEAYATDKEKQNYITWWTLVSKRLKDKDYRLSFNLFTEVGIDACGDDCSQSLRRNTAKYNDWTKSVVKAIRGTGGNNQRRILILGSPEKTAKGLTKIDPSIYENDNYMMAEFHLYASGPTKTLGDAKYWDGGSIGKQNVRNALQPALDWTKKTGILTYFGAWMAEDNMKMSLTEDEVTAFSRFFVETLKENGIPWSLNVLDRYYDTKKSVWIEGDQTIKGKTMDFKKILTAIINSM